MKIASVSDLHCDHPDNGKALQAIFATISNNMPDVFILAGDLGSDLRTLGRTLLQAKKLAQRVIFVPGNHDLWFPGPNAEAVGHDTWLLYREILPELCRQIGVHYLPQAPLEAGGIAFVGTTGWYDFSLATRSARLMFSPEDFSRGQFLRYAWADLQRTCFRNSDDLRMNEQQIVASMLDDLSSQLRSLSPAIHSVIAITHVVAFPIAVPSRAIPAFDYFSAFLGSVKFGQVLEQDPRVRVAIYGHTHTPGDFQVGTIRVVGTPLGYPRERLGMTEASVTQSRIAWIEL